jgi:CheY-like chemotaxis protein
MSFSRALKKYRNGDLENVNETRVCSRQYDEVEKKVVQYVDLRERLFLKDKCGLAWIIIQDKALGYAKALGLDSGFKASPGWIANCLKRAGKVSISLHGEAMDLTDEEAADLMKPWRVKFHAAIEKHDIPPSRCYNADQTGLYFTKTPNRLYVNSADRLDGTSTNQDESAYLGDYSSRSECLNILVVDDVSSNRKLLSRLLKNRGHYSDMAEDGAVALAMVKQAIADKNPYDTILLDYEMPVMNGPTTATELRAMGCDVLLLVLQVTCWLRISRTFDRVVPMQF